MTFEEVRCPALPVGEEACEAVRAAWREAEELQLSMPLAVEALLVDDEVAQAA